MSSMFKTALLTAFAATATGARADEPLTFRGTLSWLNTYQHTTPLDSDVNPENGPLAVPHDALVSDLRPNTTLTAGPLQIIARPRVRYVVQDAKTDAKNGVTNGSSKAWLNEAFGQWAVSERTTFVLGRQNYQWGAAETLSPTNKIFHDSILARDVTYEEVGRDIARVNFSFGKQLSVVAMGEVQENKDAPVYTQGETFQSTGLVKPEYSWNQGADYLGLVAGGRQHGQPWAGEYFNFGFPGIDGLSVFGDVSHERGSDAWYPAATAGPGGRTLVVFEQSRQGEAKVETLAVGGLKYDFVNGLILRGEYVLNQAGYGKGEQDLALAAFRSPDPAAAAVRADNTQRFLTPGLALPGQRYAYGSLHVPDCFRIVDLNLDLRSLVSLRDASSATYAEVDYRVGDNGTVSLAETATAGRKDADLRGYSSPTHLVAYRQDW